VRLVVATPESARPGTEGSAANLFGSESAQCQHWDLLDILGAEAVLRREADDAPLGAAVDETFRRGMVAKAPTPRPVVREEDGHVAMGHRQKRDAHALPGPARKRRRARETAPSQNAEEAVILTW
jgi:hypothetical protein